MLINDNSTFISPRKKQGVIKKVKQENNVEYKARYKTK
jgi:hypothetical protein